MHALRNRILRSKRKGKGNNDFIRYIIDNKTGEICSVMPLRTDPDTPETDIERALTVQGLSFRTICVVRRDCSDAGEVIYAAPEYSVDISYHAGTNRSVGEFKCPWAANPEKARTSLAGTTADVDTNGTGHVTLLVSTTDERAKPYATSIFALWKRLFRRQEHHFTVLGIDVTAKLKTDDFGSKYYEISAHAVPAQMARAMDAVDKVGLCYLRKAEIMQFGPSDERTAFGASLANYI
jgi:hypothetical protein